MCLRSVDRWARCRGRRKITNWSECQQFIAEIFLLSSRLFPFLSVQFLLAETNLIRFRDTHGVIAASSPMFVTGRARALDSDCRCHVLVGRAAAATTTCVACVWPADVECRRPASSHESPPPPSRSFVLLINYLASASLRRPYGRLTHYRRCSNHLRQVGHDFTCFTCLFIYLLNLFHKDLIQ